VAFAPFPAAGSVVWALESSIAGSAILRPHLTGASEEQHSASRGRGDLCTFLGSGDAGGLLVFKLPAWRVVTSRPEGAALPQQPHEPTISPPPGPAGKASGAASAAVGAGVARQLIGGEYPRIYDVIMEEPYKYDTALASVSAACKKLYARVEMLGFEGLSCVEGSEPDEEESALISAGLLRHVSCGSIRRLVSRRPIRDWYCGKQYPRVKIHRISLLFFFCQVFGGVSSSAASACRALRCSL
jgi:hypothetical protein